MKLSSSIVFLAAALLSAPTTSASITPTSSATAANECGTLGVMQVTDLPQGANETDIRKCADHPLGRNRSVNGTSTLAGRAADSCEKGSPYGCSGGYCWKVCGPNGEWCWTAKNLGTGDWITCSTFNDCGTTTYACGRGCLSTCGCSC